MKQVRALMLILMMAAGLILSSCSSAKDAGKPTGSAYVIDEDLLGKKITLSEVIDFSEIDEADRCYRRVQDNVPEKKLKTEVLNAEETREVIAGLKKSVAAPGFGEYTSIWDESDFVLTFEFKKAEETIGKVNVFSIEGKSVLGFEMKVITEKLRHPSMRFYAEDDGFAGKLKP